MELSDKSELFILLELQKNLESIYGYKEFRDKQAQIMIKIIKNKKDLLILMPSGGGKSLLFQLPAIVENKISLVVMPLISLIQDQVYQMRQIGINVLDFTNKNDYDNIEDKSVKLIFVTPEKLDSDVKLQQIINDLYYNQKRLNRVIIDEAHCISQWGGDFRKTYGQLGQLKDKLQGIQVIALTATAPEQTKNEIIQNLKLNKDYELFTSSFNRPNLFYSVEKKEKVKVFDLIQYQIQVKHKGESGLIYCSTKAKCEEVAKELQKKNVICDYYHAGLSDSKRKQLYLQWMTDQIQVLVATISLGMGINKPDIRYVLHYTPSQSIEAYYQESGRAGRDGKPSDCILYYDTADNNIQNFIISQDVLLSDQQKKQKLSMYKQFVEYCENKTICRRVFQLKYLGEQFEQSKCNKNCDICFQELNQSKKLNTKDKTQEALDVLNYLSGYPGTVKLTKIQLRAALKGSSISMKNTNSKQIIEKSKLYGYMKSQTVQMIEQFVNQLQSQGFISEKMQKVGAYFVSQIQLDYDKIFKIRNKELNFTLIDNTKSLAQNLQEGQKLAQISKSLQPQKKTTWNFKKKPEAEQIKTNLTQSIKINQNQSNNNINTNNNQIQTQQQNQQLQQFKLFEKDQDDELAFLEREQQRKELLDSQQQERQKLQNLQNSEQQKKEEQKQLSLGKIMFNEESGFCTQHQFQILDYQLKSIRIQEFLEVQKENEFLTLETFMPKQFVINICKYLPESVEEMQKFSKQKFNTKILEKFLEIIINFISDQNIKKQNYYIPTQFNKN